MANAEKAADGREFGPVANRVILENDRVRIWELELEPGEQTALHKHHLDYVQVEIEGDKIKGLIEPDASGTYTKDIEVDVEPGRVFWVQRGGVEIAKNTGEKYYRGILIELKD